MQHETINVIVRMLFEHGAPALCSASVFIRESKVLQRRSIYTIMSV